MSGLKRGTQIVYIPQHAEGDRNHKDVEEGFVTSVRGNSAFCRYWSKYDRYQLRTKANSESTSIRDLVIEATRTQDIIDEMLEDIGG